MAYSMRLLRAPAAGIAFAVLLAGCSGTSNGGASSTGADSIKGNIRMSYWGSSSRVTKTNAITQLFQKQYPQATAQPQLGTWTTYFQKLNVQAASKTLPDVITLQTRQLADYTGTGVLLPLDSMVKSGEINVSNIPATVLNSGRGADGKLYMIPYGVAYNALGINQAMAKQYNIPALPNTYTWDEFVTWLKEAKSKLPAGVAPTAEHGGLEPVFSAWVLSNGEKMFDSSGKIGFPKSTLTTFWNNWEQLRKQGLTTSMQNQVDEPVALEQFYLTTGKALSEQIAGNALAPIDAAAPALNVTEVPFATGPAGLGNMFFTNGYSIAANSKNQATAAAFINFWTNNDAGAKIYNSDNGVVANTKQLAAQMNDASATAATKQELAVYNFILSKKVPQPTIPSGYNATFEQSFLREYENVAFGKETVSQAVDAFFTEANASLK